jgi:diguanylate cyclase (GGDEF)-like protein/PAS domain S-box-containing protein
MATPIWKAAITTPGRHAKAGIAPDLCQSLNLPENSDSAEQQEVLDALPVLVFLERAGKVVFANAEARQTLGVAEGEWVERPVEDVLWGLFPGTAEPQTQLIGTRSSSPFHATLPARNGRLLPVEGTYGILNAELREAIIVAQPSGRVRAPKSRLMEDVLASIPEAVVILHSNHVLYTNPAFTQMFGYTADEASGESLRELIVPETRQHELALLEKEVDQKGRVSTETVRINKDGELLDVALVAAPLRVDGTSVGYVLSFRDIGDRKQAEAKLQHDALFDVLTGLPNRALFLDRLTLALNRRTRRRDQNCGVLLLDLDRFQEINDALGHAAGNELLVAVAERLRSFLRPEDSASRIGDDGFALLVENILDQDDLEAVAGRILEKMGDPFEVFGSLVRVSASMGVAMAGPGHTAELLVRDADFALNRARLSGGGCSEVFNMQLEMPFGKCQQDPERELRRVLERRLYEVWYQPIYHLKSGELEGFESLLRLRRPDGSVDSFLEMLGVAENTGLSITLGRETMDAVCRQLHAWSDGVSKPGLILTLNLTERQFYHPEMVAQLHKALAANAVDPSRLVFEVTEGTLNQNPEVAAGILKRMAESKVRLAVDNFGSRFAPLNHLARLPIDVMKISPKLLAAATDSSGRQAAVLQSLIHLGQALGIQVIAQGIETPEQLDALTRMGCVLGQGHLFSYALEPARATKLAGLGRWSLAAGA